MTDYNLKNILTSEEVSALDRLIKGSEHVVLTCHKSPDGDAIGSCLGLAEYLRVCYGKAPVIIIPDAFPDFLKWLPGVETIRRFDKHADECVATLSAADLLFSLDYDGAGRLEAMASAFLESKARRIVIDHHGETTLPYDMDVTRSGASSTCELVLRIILQLGGYGEVSRKCAVPLYCGMMTDTGAFTYNSSDPEIFHLIAILLSKGFDKDKVYRNVYNNYSQWAVRLRGYIMFQKLNVFEQAHACYYALTRQEMHRFHFVRGDAEGLVNVPLTIKGMRMSISLREDDRKDNTVWVSLRSVDNYDMRLVAERFFNGGGHLNACGGHLFCSMDEAEKICRQAIEWFAGSK